MRQFDPQLLLSPPEGALHDYMSKLPAHRLSKTKRAMLATNYITSTHGGARRGMDPAKGQTLTDVAEALRISPRLIRYARDIRNAGSAAVTNAVARGDMRISDALFILEHCKTGRDRAFAVRQRIHHGKRWLDCLPEHIAGPLGKRWAQEREAQEREWAERRAKFIEWQAQQVLGSDG